MNSKQHKTLNAIFSDPIEPGIAWKDVETLFTALGAAITEGNGSRIRVSLNGVRWSFHRPHPEKTAGRARIKDVRTFLRNAGVKNVHS